MTCYRIMSNKQMVGYAEVFENGGGMSPPAGWRPKWKKEFHDLVAMVFRAGQGSWPQRLKRAKSRMTDVQRDIVERLCAGRDEIAKTLDVEGSLLGSRGDLEQLVVNPQDESPLMPWQEEVLRPVMTSAASSSDVTEPGGV